MSTNRGIVSFSSLARVSQSHLSINLSCWDSILAPWTIWIWIWECMALSPCLASLRQHMLFRGGGYSDLMTPRYDWSQMPRLHIHIKSMLERRFNYCRSNRFDDPLYLSKIPILAYSLESYLILYVDVKNKHVMFILFSVTHLSFDISSSRRLFQSLE